MNDKPNPQRPEFFGQVGGEALMEGLMMRGPKGAAVAVRLPSGEIDVSLKPGTLPKDKYPILGWPLIRGPVSLVYSMIFGYKCLMESADKATQGLMEEAAAQEDSSKLDKWLEEHLGPQLMTVIGVVGSVLGVALALGLFVWAPELLLKWIEKLSSADLTHVKALISGGIRVVLFVGYMFVMSLLPDIRRVFQYHGAEHKTIFCYESGLELTVENVKKQSRLHPRCGTSFMFLMILLSILLSSLLFAIWPQLSLTATARVCIKILQFPVIMALGYEFIRFAGKHLENPIVKIISFPGLCTQRITTKEPDEEIIEVGIAALKASLGETWKQEPVLIEGADTIAGDDAAPGSFMGTEQTE
ncbi:MAG: DUF1385 domain-containing protein [Oscillospiraceae bacterium]|jgi:uncharacterized protein YqhQ|nr:DUF1385 domain-containing protein [Oscillospiraceae bacterium]